MTILWTVRWLIGIVALAGYYLYLIAFGGGRMWDIARILVLALSIPFSIDYAWAEAQQASAINPTNLTDAELEPVTKHAIKGRRLQADIQKLQEKINAMPEVKHVQTEQKSLQDEEEALTKQILKAHKLDDGKHVVDFQQGRIVEQQQAPPAKPAK